MISRRLLLGAGLAAPFVSLGVNTARAQGFPERPIRYLVSLVVDGL